MTKVPYAEQIRAFTEQRAAFVAQQEGIIAKAAEEGATLDADQQAEFDEIEADIEAVDKHIANLRKMEAKAKAAVVPVSGDSAETASRTRVEVKREEKLDKGIAFARLARVKALSKLDVEPQAETARRLYGENSKTYGIVKAAVEAGTSAPSSWTGALVGEETSIFADFNEFLRPMSIVGRFGTNGIPALRAVPFRVPLIGQTEGGEAYWTGEAKPKGLTKFNFDRTTLEPLKLAAIAVLSEEVIRDSNPNAEVIIRDQLAAALAARWDRTFIDPANSGATGVRPASITNGADTVAAETYVDADSVRLDLRSLFQKFILANNAPTNGVWIMNHTTALALSLIMNPLGQPEFPGMSMMGGTLEGLPVITSQYVGDIVVLVNAQDIYIGDEGGIQIDLSREASLEMLDVGFDQDQPVGAELVSLWQNNLVGLRAERTVSWKRNPFRNSVAVLTGVAWGGEVNVA
jgi:HK97 family phage major capsid protein